MPEMEWMRRLACFGGGACLTNAIPHLISGVTERPFQSPFAERVQGIAGMTSISPEGLPERASFPMAESCDKVLRHDVVQHLA
jgi:hypothetical protein